MSTRARATSMRAVRHGAARRRSAIATAVQQLQAAGRRGVLPPPQDISRGMFWRDRSRTQPYTEANKEQPVEFVDDLSANPVGWQLGQDLVTNGTFDSGTNGWSTTSGGETFTATLGRATLSGGDPYSGYAFQLIQLSAGKKYRIAGTATSNSRITCVRLSTGAEIGGMSAAAGSFGFFVTPQNSGLYQLRLIRWLGGDPCSFDNITVQEVILDESWMGPNLVANSDNEAACFASAAQRGTITQSNERSQTGSFSAKYTCTNAAATNADHFVTAFNPVPAGKNVVIEGWYYLPSGSFNSLTINDGNDGSFPNAAMSVKDAWTFFRVVRGNKAANWALFIGAAGQTSSAGFSYFLDNVTVREIPGHPIVSAVAGSGLVLSRRVSMLQRTTWLGAVAGSPGTAPTGWATGFWTGSLDIPSAGALTFSVNGTRQFITQSVAVVANTSYRARVSVISNSGVNVSSILSWNHASLTGTSIQYQINGVDVSTVAVPQAGDVVACVLSVGTTAGTMVPRFGIGCSTADTGSVTLSSPDIRPTFWDQFPGIPEYQRVNDGTAGVLDYDDSPAFPLHWRNINGTQAMMTLGTVDMSAGDAGAIVAGFIGLSGASTAVLAETSANAGSASFPGSLFVAAPNAANTISFSHRGSVAVGTRSESVTYPGVYSIAGEGDISTDLARISVNGVQSPSAIVDQGTGNLGNHRFNIAGRDVGGASNLRFTGILLHLPALVAADAGIDLQALAREYAASAGFIY